MPCGEYVKARVLLPLGMRGAAFDRRQVPPDGLAGGYRRGGEALVPVTSRLEPDSAGAAAGGLHASLRDLARYAAFHLAAWPPRDDPEAGPLRRSSAREMQQAARHALLVASPGIGGLPPHAATVGYGFGLSSIEACDIAHEVAHSGGLPGFGSRMVLWPDRGVGIVDDAAADAAFTRSFFLDTPRVKRGAELEALRAAHGACRPDGPIDAENALRGTFRLACERGWIEVTVTLAPTMPPRIQHLAAEGAPRPQLRDLMARGGRARTEEALGARCIMRP